MMVVRLFGILGISLICLIYCVECLPKPQERETDIEYSGEDEDAGEDSLYDDQQQQEQEEDEGQQEQDNYTDDDDDNNEEAQEDDQDEET
jgi:hypothetical protein